MEYKKITIEEFERRLSEVEKACKDWLRCELETSVVRRIFNQHSRNKVTIQGYSEFPDDFDWDSLPKDFAQRCEKAIENEIRVQKLIAISRIAFENLEKRQSDDSIFSRSICFGRAAALELDR